MWISTIYYFCFYFTYLTQLKYFEDDFSKIEKVDEIYLYRVDLEKRERCDVLAHERLTEPRVTGSHS